MPSRLDSTILPRLHFVIKRVVVSATSDNRKFASGKSYWNKDSLPSENPSCSPRRMIVEANLFSTEPSSILPFLAVFLKPLAGKFQ